ncbi:sulfite oxidase [Georgenia halophila]|uniref:Sulfite oxidase n=1 Tax=Georgenia halophila TaxID=620889 RepID=A0ABP8LPZ1_9MICO
MGLAELVAYLGGTGPGPVEAVAEAFIDRTPPWLKDLAIDLFGTADKLALGIGITVVMGALAVAAGLSERAARGRGAAVLAVLAVIAAGATLTRPDGGVVATWPVLASAVAGALALMGLLAPARPVDPERAMADRKVLDRRRLLLGAGTVSGLAVVGGTVARFSGGARPVSAPPLDLPAPATPAPTLPAGADLDIQGLAPFRTPNETFYRIDTAFVVPRVDPEEWTLRVHGMVEQEVVLTLDDLLAEDLVESWVTLCCVSNQVGGDLIGNALWLGLPVRTVLERAGVREDADMVLSRSVDGFSASTPLQVLMDDRDALLAVGMNGSDLPPEHGYPVRVVVPGLYGYVSATKWLSELEVTRFEDQTAYWTERGWAPRGPVKISSRIDVPRAGRTRDAGEVIVAGVAWDQHVGIAAVEVRVDGGDWQPAELADEVTVDTWRQWVYRWDAAPGSHTLEVRATNHDGEVQTSEVQGTVPDGATGLHRIEVDVA